MHCKMTRSCQLSNRNGIVGTLLTNDATHIGKTNTNTKRSCYKICHQIPEWKTIGKVHFYFDMTIISGMDNYFQHRSARFGAKQKENQCCNLRIYIYICKSLACTYNFTFDFPFLDKYQSRALFICSKSFWLVLLVFFSFSPNEIQLKTKTKHTTPTTTIQIAKVGERKNVIVHNE